MPLIDPTLLIESCRRQPLEIFCCGPGIQHPLYDLRSELKRHLEEQYQVTVVFGEELDRITTKPSTQAVDLQTLEARYAHLVDFTVLMLESPGSIAELGTFTMTDNIRPRLYTAVDQSFYGDSSYIARGPLSILSAHSPANVIYYSRKSKTTLLSGLDFPVCLHKYLAHSVPRYDFEAKLRFRAKRPPESGHYSAITKKHRDDFIAKCVLVAVNVLHNPTFAELVNELRTSPDEVSHGLKKLFQAGHIKKTGSGEYVATPPMASGALAPFSTTAVSRRRARVLAA
ncbi:retron St85 family effector protein [Aquisalimonas lutea]|uniref:retron St85 family effector protein n=1 Tax=Aquisalimonas lutea TaxID=1327750 RepID=UPI00338E8B55